MLDLTADPCAVVPGVFRAVELLQSLSSDEKLAFALGNYGRALW